jgi:hypothetical protein
MNHAITKRSKHELRRIVEAAVGDLVVFLAPDWAVRGRPWRLVKVIRRL